MTEIDSLLIVLAGVFLISFMKGAFGGGFAILGIPLLALTMDPVTAGALLAPLFILMDLVALWYWRPGTWSWPDLKILVPGLVAGIVAGALLLRVLPPGCVAILTGVVTLVFALMWFAGGGAVRPRPRSSPKAAVAGMAAGVTTMIVHAGMIAHAGGPPLALYLLSRGLPKAVYAGTTSIFFTTGNVIKAGPWLWLAKPEGPVWWLMATCAAVIPPGIWSGWQLHDRLPQRQLYRLCYILLVLTAGKLLFDGVVLVAQHQRL